MNVEVAGVIVVCHQEDPHSCHVSCLASSSHEHGPLEAGDLRKLINVAQFNGSSGLDVAISVATATVTR